MKKLMIFVATLCIGARALLGADPDSHAQQDAIIKVTVKYLIEAAPGSPEARARIGAYFVNLKDPAAETRLQGFMAEHKPRVEMGVANLVDNGGRLTDKVTHLAAILVRV